MAELEAEPDPRDWLVAIVNGSDDAIISKDLNGIIRTWNPSATRVLGYGPEEVVGKPITIVIPEDRLNEEPGILAEIRRGNRVDHFETLRRRKDGSLIDLSLTISPIRNSKGAIVGDNLTMPDWQGDAFIGQSTTLQALMRAILQPYAGHHVIDIRGDDPQVSSRALTHVALLLHELATNAAKYGCLAVAAGRLDLEVRIIDGDAILIWTEQSGSAAAPPENLGFGARLAKATQISLQANIERDWRPTGLLVRITMPLDILTK